ncbi:MAG: hypothetical protein AAB552_03495 [Patescibacteria group bacterium]
MKHFSKLGLWLAGVYGVIASGIIYYAFTCSGEYCGFIILLPIMPWPLLAEVIPRSQQLFGVLNSPFGAFVFLFLNVAIIYFAGALIESLIKKIKSRNNSQI